MGEAARKLKGSPETSSPSEPASQGPKLHVAPDSAPSTPTKDAEKPSFEPIRLMSRWGDVLNTSRPIMAKYAKKQSELSTELAHDPLNVRVIAQKVLNELSLHPQRIYTEFSWRVTKYTELGLYSFWRLWGAKPQPVVVPKSGDNRFRDEHWTKTLNFDLAKQAYLIWSDSVQRLFGEIPNTDPVTKRRITFYTKLYTDSLAPTNFAWTNPEVIHKTFNTYGENLIDGFTNWLRDVERGDGALNMTTSDNSKFEIGKNIACTPGKVVFENSLMQLIQYNPTTEKVAKTPVLVTPAWINKFYILDLQQKNSLIKFIVDKGYTVFAISWVNPTKELAGKHFEHYLLEGPVAAIEQIRKATGSEQVNLVGYCLGGTLTATTAAYLANRGINAVKSMTLLTTLTDFSEPGDLQVFIDKVQVDGLEKKMTTKGFLEAHEMTAAFNMLRSNELIWQPMINNYFLAKPSPSIDFLAWNSDATRMPAEMHKFYLRKMYVENVLRRPNGIYLNKTPIDLSRIECPVYQISAKDDHIAPWKSTYAGTQIFSGPRRFVLSESGHIAGVVNPPANKKYNHWVNEDLPADPENWFGDAKYTTGSWWDDWANWIEKNTDAEKVPARTPGDGELKALEDAPGTYVKVRIA